MIRSREGNKQFVDHERLVQAVEDSLLEACDLVKVNKTLPQHRVRTYPTFEEDIWRAWEAWGRILQ